MKKKLIIIGCVLCIALSGCTASQTKTENTIPYPEGYSVDGGAAAAHHEGDHQKSEYFAHPDIFHMKSNQSLTLLETFKTYQQTTEWSCGNATALMVLHHFGDTRFTELGLVEKMKTTPLPDDGNMLEGVYYGTQTEGVANFFKSIGYEVKSSLDSEPMSELEQFREWVIKNLSDDTPIMVDWLDWSGHWQAIIGYDTMGTDTPYDDVLIFADPYDVGDQLQDGYYLYPVIRFFYMWTDFQFQPKGSNTQQWVTAKPKNGG